MTTLTDVESLSVLDVYIVARWKHDTKTGPQVVRRNADDLLTVTAVNGFQDWKTEYEIAALDVEYFVHYRGSSLNAVIKKRAHPDKGLFSAVDGRDFVLDHKAIARRRRASMGWYRQFREIVLMFAIINIEALCETL